MGSSGEKEGTLRFNHIDFSDRVLRLEIVPALPSITNDGSNTSEFGAIDFKFKKIHINSLLLAYKSQFFYKLFKNGMKETQQGDEVALKIDESEEAAFLDLLKFIYDHSVDASSAPDLVGVLMAADKFEVPSCIRYCVELLLKLPMSTELALVYLGLPPSVLADEVVQTLIESTKSYICAHYSDFTKYQKEVMGLPLCVVETVLGRDDLQVNSEDVVFDFTLKWGRLHYPELEERREILTRLLVNFICLPNMSSLKLKEVFDCSDFDFEKVWKPVVDALVSKDQDIPATKCEYPRRIYNHKVVKVVQLQLTRPRCVIYFDLAKEDCEDLVAPKRLYSQGFGLGEERLQLLAQCTKVEQKTLGVYVYKTAAGSETCTLGYTFEVMKNSCKEFTSLVEENNLVLKRDMGRGCPDLFKTPWEELMGDESEYFIDGILHLRADITLLS